MTVTNLPANPLPPNFAKSVGTNAPASYVDISLDTPDAQFQALSDLLAYADSVSPAPFTGTPPGTEGTPPEDTVPDAVLNEKYVIGADVDADANAELLSVISDYFPPDTPERLWYNDDQYHGLGVPPGVQNLDQPIESGHTQIIRNDPSAEHGWDAWSGRPQLARVARMFNNFPAYNAGQNRGHGVVPEKLVMPLALQTQQFRDLLLSELNRRGVHNVVVADVPSVPYTEQVQVTDPSMLTPEPAIGPQGVLPW